MTEREFIEACINYWKDLRNRFLKHYQELDGVVDEEMLSKVGDIISTTEQRITELRKQLPPQDEVEKLLNEASKILNSDEKHLYLTELEEAERKLSRARQIIKQGIGDCVVVNKNPIIRRVMELEKRKETLYPLLVAISPFAYREAMKDITEAVERLKKLPSDIVKYGLLPCHVETIIHNYDCLVEEDDQLWIERNIISQDTLESIRAHAFKEVGRIAVVDMQCKVLSNGFYSSKVAKTYMEYTKRMNEEYREMLDKAHEEALNEALHRDLWARFDKPKEEALCEAADKTLQKYADRAAKGNILKEMFEVKQQSDKKFLITPKKAGRAIIVHAHDTKGTSMVIKEASKKTSTPTWRVGALMQESPAKKQRKSLVRAIINLLDTKYK